ncbi:MAG: hypothetical protein WBX14_12920, partial [Candidatus Udaeobacter sp.]
MKTITKFIYVAFAAVVVAMGAVTANGAPADLFASVNRPNPTGPNGAIFEYTPTGVQSTFVANVVEPRGLAFDSVGNLFVASTDSDANGNDVGTIFKVKPGGVVSTFTTSLPNNFFLDDIKFDSMGNLFVDGQNENDPNFASTIFKVSPGGAVSTFGSVPFQGFGLAFDSMGNLFASSGDPAIYKFTPAGMRSVFVGPSAFTSVQGPTGLAFDSAGNLFVSTEENLGNDTILEFTPAGVETTFATGLPNNPRGLAFDSAGNLFVAEVPGPGGGPGDILKFTPGGVETVFAAGVGRPQGNGGPEFLAFPPPPCQFSTSISSNFNAFPINAGNYLWFTGVLKANGLGSIPVTITFTGQTITSPSFTQSVPDATVRFDPAVNFATTTFGPGGVSTTTVPSNPTLAGNTFFSALSFLVPAGGLPGGIKNVLWSGTISIDTPGVTVNWQWAAAVYPNVHFSADPSMLGVKPTDDNKNNPYLNNDHAGTPENFKTFV